MHLIHFLNYLTCVFLKKYLTCGSNVSTVDPDWVINGAHWFISWGFFFVQKFLDPFSRPRRTKHRLITILITRMDGESQDKSTKPLIHH
jgi:hypothetical protein